MLINVAVVRLSGAVASWQHRGEVEDAFVGLGEYLDAQLQRAAALQAPAFRPKVATLSWEDPTTPSGFHLDVFRIGQDGRPTALATIQR